MESIWKEALKERQIKRLTGTHHTRVAVIGAGMAGILSAYLLQEAGMKVTVVESNALGSGQTGGTTAKITSQHGMIYSHLEKYFGKVGAGLYAAANESAIDEYERIIGEQQIECDFRRCPAYLYALDGEGQEERLLRLKKEIELVKSLGISAEFVSQTELPLPVAGAEVFWNQAQFHPLKFLQHLAEELTVYEYSQVKEVKDNCLYTKEGMLVAEHIVFTNHYPWQIRPGYYFLRMHQERSYVLALQQENANQERALEGMYRDMNPTGMSFRRYGNYLLIGGSGHRTGKNNECGNYDVLRKQAERYYPKAEEVAHWSAQDCITLDKVPYVGYFSREIPNWYVATGFGKWGMTGAMVSAIILRDMIQGLEHPWEAIYTPQRMNWRADIQQLCGNLGSATVNLAKRLFPFSVKGKEKPPVCQHMGCQLVWNPDEHSWDCPCHGSRYSEEGKLLCGPSQKPLEERKKE